MEVRIIRTSKKVSGAKTYVIYANKCGKIKANSKGTCYIYAYAQNGISTKIKVTVK